jgi:hypothetical protein
MTPPIGGCRALMWSTERSTALDRQQVSVLLGDRRHEPELSNERKRRSVGAGFGRDPIHCRTVEHGGGEIMEELVTGRHASDPAVGKHR